MGIGRVVANRYRVEIVGAHRESRRQAEKINVNLRYLKKPVYSTKK
jgi:hypothetical protein